MANFTADPGAFPPRSGILGTNQPLPFITISEGNNLAFKNREIPPTGGWVQLGTDSIEPAYIQTVPIIDITFTELIAEPTGVFINALLAAQTQLSGAIPYPRTGQRWPWKADYFYRNRG